MPATYPRRRARLWAAALTCALGLGLWTSQVRAQPSVTQARRDLAQLDAVLDCLEARRRKMSEALRLMDDAAQQLQSKLATERDRRDAEIALDAMAERVRQLRVGMERCLENPEQGAREPKAPRIVYKKEELSEAEQAVQQDNPATRVFMRDVPLADGVRVEVGEQVDGSGKLADPLAKGAIHSIAARLGRCYLRARQSEPDLSGKLILAFRVDQQGRTRRVAVEGSGIADPGLRRCVQRAGRRVRVGARPTGGTATYSFTLRFRPK